MIYTDDPAHDFDAWAAEQEKKLERSPVCDRCHEHIQEDFLYDFDGEIVCDGCLYDYVKQFERPIG